MRKGANPIFLQLKPCIKKNCLCRLQDVALIPEGTYVGVPAWTQNINSWTLKYNTQCTRIHSWKRGLPRGSITMCIRHISSVILHYNIAAWMSTNACCSNLPAWLISANQLQWRSSRHADFLRWWSERLSLPQLTCNYPIKCTDNIFPSAYFYKLYGSPLLSLGYPK